MPIGNQIKYTDNVASKIISATATASQTTFTIVGGYRINAIAVYKQGLRLANGVDFTATDGETVILTSGASADDKLVFQIYDDFNVAEIASAPGDFTVGNQLSVSGLSTVANLYSTGIITATGGFDPSGDLIGNVAASHGLKATAGGIHVVAGVSTFAGAIDANSTLDVDGDTQLDDLNVAGVATFSAYPAIDANEEIQVGTAIQIGKAGVVTATTFKGALTGNVTGDVSGSSGSCTGNAATATLATNASGLSGSPSITVTNITASGTLIYDDVRNVDSLGIITARNGARVTAGGLNIVSGVSTFANQIDANGSVDITGIITASHGARVTAGGLNIVSGVSTFANQIDANGSVDVAGIVTASHGFRATTGGINVVSGVSTFANQIDANGSVDITGIVTASHGTRVTAGGINVVSGVSTFANQIDANGSVDVAGIVTASHGVRSTAGGANLVGIVTVTQGTVLNGYKVEEGSYDSDALNGEFDFEFENGHIQTHTGSTAGTYFPDFRVSSAQSLDSVMAVGDVVSATLIVAASNTAHYCTTGIKIDNSTSNLTIEWIGSAAASAGKGAGYDIYAFTIQKTAATPAYLIIVNALDAG